MTTSAARRVLVIEDDSETASRVANCLQDNGYAVDVADDGEAGIARASAPITRS